MSYASNPMARVRTTTINDKQVQIYLLPASEGIKMAKELAEVVVPTLGSFYQGVAEGLINFEQLSLVLISEMDKLDISLIISRLLKDVAINSGAVDFDSYFMANYGELVEIVAYALKENFQSFFAAKGLFDKYLPKVEKEQTEAE